MSDIFFRELGMPEEINRKLTDAISDLLFVTEESGMRNLRAEGVPAERREQAGPVFGALALIVAKGFVSTEKAVNFAAPAHAAAAQPVIPRAFAIPPPLPRSQALR
jgi:UDP-N-acetylglucosamine 2-epimerase